MRPFNWVLAEDSVGIPGCALMSVILLQQSLLTVVSSHTSKVHRDEREREEADHTGVGAARTTAAVDRMVAARNFILTIAMLSSFPAMMSVHFGERVVDESWTG